MRFFAFLMIAVLILAMAGPFFIKGRDGRPLLTAGEVFPSGDELRGAARNGWNGLVRKAERMLDRQKDATPPGQTMAIYKWQDTQGNWHYSDDPNPKGASEQMLVDPNANVVPGLPVERTAPPSGEPAAQPPKSQDDAGLPVPISLSPGRVKELVEDAQRVQEVLDDRSEAMDAASRDE